MELQMREDRRVLIGKGYKAKRIDNDEWVKGDYYLGKQGESYSHYVGKVPEYYLVDKNTLCQCLRHRAINGHVYLQDKIMTERYGLVVVLYHDKDKQVYFGLPKGTFLSHTEKRNIDNYVLIDYSISIIEESEIIGNIHD